MLIDLLQEYREHLLGAYSKDTAETYYKRLSVLFESQPITDTAERLDVRLLLSKLGEIKHKNHFSQSKNALLHFCKWRGVKLSADTLSSVGALEKATKKKYRKLKPVDFRDIDKRIKHLRNMKLKLSFQSIIATGLRVSELSGLSPGDCAISEDFIIINFIGKGGKDGEVSINASDSPLLHERLLDLIKNTTPNEKLFYSAGYLQSKAKDLGFTCHDLRRAYAKLEYKKCRNKAEVSEKLRHSNTRTTNIYLRSKVKI